MKIIFGKHKKKSIYTSTNISYRPVTGRLRESIFQVLLTNYNHIVNKNVLDLFAGTGILSFESLSIGAKHATLVDNNKSCISLIKKSANKLSEVNNIYCNYMNVLYLYTSIKKYDLVFIDPPYSQTFISYNDIFSSLINKGWLSNNCIIIIFANTNFISEIFDKRISFLKVKNVNNRKVYILFYGG